MRKLNSVEEILETTQMGRERKSGRQIKRSERKRCRIKLKPFIDFSNLHKVIYASVVLCPGGPNERALG